MSRQGSQLWSNNVTALQSSTSICHSHGSPALVCQRRSEKSELSASLPPAKLVCFELSQIEEFRISIRIVQRRIVPFTTYRKLNKHSIERFIAMFTRLEKTRGFDTNFPEPVRM